DSVAPASSKYEPSPPSSLISSDCVLRSSAVIGSSPISPRQRLTFCSGSPITPTSGNEKPDNAAPPGVRSETFRIGSAGASVQPSGRSYFKPPSRGAGGSVVGDWVVG